MKEISWTVDSNQILMGPCLSDGYLTGIMVEDSNARLFVINAWTQKLQITFSGVKALRVKNFLQGNIILTVWVRKDRTKVLELLEKTFPHPDASEFATADSSKLAKTEAERLLNLYPDLSIFHLEPTYGAEVIIAFESLKIIEQLD